MLTKIKLFFRYLTPTRLKISSDIIHYEVHDFHYSVSEEDIKNYNEVTDKKDFSVAHPLYYTRISWQIIENLNKLLKIPFDEQILKTIIHQSEHVTIHKQLRAPANLRVEGKIWSIIPHKKGTKMTIKFTYYSGNEIMAVEYARGLLFGVKCLDKGASLGATPRPERVESSVIWEENIDIQRNLPYKYAEKTDINADIHTNPDFAKTLGLPDIIVQGTCTFAKSISLIAAKELNADTNRIKSVVVNFIGMLVPPNKIKIRLLKKENNKLFFDVLNKSGDALLKGGEINYE